MARPADLNRVKRRVLARLAHIEARYDRCRTKLASDYGLVRWIAAMTAVEAYAAWEWYAEHRLVAALTLSPNEFIEKNGVRGLHRIPVGLAAVLVRGSSRYFDFRSCSELLSKADKLVGKAQNPFRKLSKQTQDYLDTLSAIRNCVVHESDAALATYKRQLSTVYGMKARPEPYEFLNALDFRLSSPLRRKPRVSGLIAIVSSAVRAS